VKLTSCRLGRADSRGLEGAKPAIATGSHPRKSANNSRQNRAPRHFRSREGGRDLPCGKGIGDFPQAVQCKRMHFASMRKLQTNSIIVSTICRSRRRLEPASLAGCKRIGNLSWLTFPSQGSGSACFQLCGAPSIAAPRKRRCLANRRVSFNGTANFHLRNASSDQATLLPVLRNSRHSTFPVATKDAIHAPVGASAYVRTGDDKSICGGASQAAV
jgi:hypothetical protein